MNFRSHSDQRTALTVHGFFGLENLGQTEVRNLDIEVFCDQNVLKLQVSMDNFLLANELEGLGNLVNDFLGNGLGNPRSQCGLFEPFLYILVQFAVLTELKN